MHIVADLVSRKLRSWRESQMAKVAPFCEEGEGKPKFHHSDSINIAISINKALYGPAISQRRPYIELT